MPSEDNSKSSKSSDATILGIVAVVGIIGLIGLLVFLAGRPNPSNGTGGMFFKPNPDGSWLLVKIPTISSEQLQSLGFTKPV